MISGTVLSQGNNRTVSQAALTIKSHEAGIFRSILTDYDGHFEVDGLPPSSYEIKIEEPGFDSLQTREKLEGPSLKLILYLKPAKWGAAPQGKYTVSVRELKIPEKAKDEYQKGMECMGKSDSAGSVNHFAKAIHVFPEFYEALSQLGMAKIHLGSMEEARQAFQTAIDLSKGKFAPAHFGFGYLLFREGKANEAEAILRRGLDVDGSAPEGHVILAMALLALNRLDEAEKSAEEALLRKPGYADAYLVRADVNAKRRNFREQIQNLEAYLKLEPQGMASARAQHAREVALKMLGDGIPRD
jgi:tetratricopeptide (TPR) repeat protein